MTNTIELSLVIPGLAEYATKKSRQFPAALEKIIIFGSFAKGTARVSSDVDIALVSANNWQISDKGDIRDIFEEFSPSMNLSLFFTTQDRLMIDDKRDANHWIRREGITIWKR